jgi:dTMP kinase
VTGRGRFITLEGGEGAGKSTHVRRLADWLRGRGVPVVTTREPGGSPRAEVLRELLLDGRVAPFGPEAEALVFAIARAEHLAETIRPALEAGNWVVSDRFLDSTWAYQGSAGVAEEVLRRLDQIAVGGDRPDLTLLLDVAPELGLRRIGSRSRAADRFEADTLAQHAARRQAFLDIASRDPRRCVVIDASHDEADVAAAIRAAVTERLGLTADAGA